MPKTTEDFEVSVIHFAANISMLFKEFPFLDRFQVAAEAGFAAVEFLWPTGIDLDVLPRAAARAGVQVALFNTDAGDLSSGSRGYLNDPSRRAYVLENFRLALDLAKELQCPRLHPLVGNALPNVPRSAQLTHVADLLKELVPLAETSGITLCVEALNSIENPYYLITNTQQALELLRMVGSQGVKYQYDIYHMQRMEGNIISTLRQHIADIGHVQIADPPGRHQPGTGELNFRNILVTLEELGYTGYVGLEYHPLGTVEESLAWLPRDRRVTCTVADLRL
jgi:hydroxypyruvate isomerase